MYYASSVSTTVATPSISNYEQNASAKLMRKVLPLTLATLVYRRCEIDKSCFNFRTVENVEYLGFSNRRITRSNPLYRILTAANMIPALIEKKYLLSLILIIISKSAKDDKEIFEFKITYEEDENRNLPPKGMVHAALKFLSNINRLELSEKYLPENVELSVQFDFIHELDLNDPLLRRFKPTSDSDFLTSTNVATFNTQYHNIIVATNINTEHLRNDEKRPLKQSTELYTPPKKTKINLLADDLSISTSDSSCAGVDDTLVRKSNTERQEENSETIINTEHLRNDEKRPLKQSTELYTPPKKAEKNLLAEDLSISTPDSSCSGVDDTLVQESNTERQEENSETIINTEHLRNDEKRPLKQRMELYTPPNKTENLLAKDLLISSADSSCAGVDGTLVQESNTERQEENSKKKINIKYLRNAKKRPIKRPTELYTPPKKTKINLLAEDLSISTSGSSCAGVDGTLVQESNTERQEENYFDFLRKINIPTVVTREWLDSLTDDEFSEVAPIIIARQNME